MAPYTTLPKKWNGTRVVARNMALKRLNTPINNPRMVRLVSGPISFNQLDPVKARFKKYKMKMDKGWLDKFRERKEAEAILFVRFTYYGNPIGHVVAVYLKVHSWDLTKGWGTLQAFDNAIYGQSRTSVQSLRNYLQRQLGIRITTERFLNASNLPKSCAINSLIVTREILAGRKIRKTVRRGNRKVIFWKDAVVLDYLNSHSDLQLESDQKN